MWQAIRWAPGVRRILTEGGAPAEIPDAVIGHLKTRINEAEARDGSSGFKHGERVVIENGPLAALDAIFDRDLDASTRVQILVQVMHRTLPVRIDPVHLRSLVG
jgi:transcription antitermination factor NusG